MKSLIVCVCFVTAATLAACGDGQSSPKAAGQGGSGGAIDGAGGRTGTSGAGGASTVSGDCAAQACLRTVDTLLASCPAQGTCVANKVSTPSTQVVTYCFGNGVRIQSTLQPSTTDGGTIEAARYVVKKDETACYVRIISELIPDLRSGGTISFSTVVQSPSGETVASTRYEADGTGWVTCPGLRETPFNQSCGVSAATLTSPFYYFGTSAPDCTDGTCDF
jgi:hypothetical protein